MIRLRTWLRDQGAGRLAYRWWHRPRQKIALARTYGWSVVWHAARGECAMRRAARRLPPLPALPESLPGIRICFLTGRNFVHQTAFCAHSFATQARTDTRFEFLSDGSLTSEDAATLLHLFPRAQVHNIAGQDQRVCQTLPPSKFPVLHAVRRDYVFLRKLTDAMAGTTGYRLYFDSDMLFWRQPEELLARAATRNPLYMADIVDDGYTMTRDAITRSLGVAAATGVNAGLVGLDASRIDWELMERACESLRNSPGDQRLLEQTLWAIALGAQDARPLAADTYRLVIDPMQWHAARIQTPSPALLHYAWHARLPYTASEWRRYLGDKNAA
ncbi:MAG: hypothetical protein PHQ04_07200 [Opitutaceae bacterium]|nr:hypothetical protein [Opitutaceae bacterium]